MEFGAADLVIAIIIFAFLFYGFFFGFVHTLITLIGAVAGIYVATHLVDPIQNFLSFIFGTGMIGKVILFILIYILTVKLLGVIFWVIDRIWGIFKWIPFAGLVDKLLGLVLGFLEGVVVVAAIIYYALLYLPEDGIRLALESSFLAHQLNFITDILKIFFVL